MKKRLLNLFLVLALVVCVLPMAASAVEGCSFGSSHTWIDGTCQYCMLTCDHAEYNDGVCTECKIVCAHAQYENGVCEECEIICPHTAYDAGFCSECGVKCAHVQYEAGKCADCETPCEHESFADGVCTVCGEACTHENWRYEAAVPATCKAPGVTYGKVCLDCGHALFGRKEIPVLAHTKATVPGYAATCTAEGRTDGEKCSVCNQTLKSQRVIAALGHDYIEEPIEIELAPTCTNRGIVRRKCSRCDETKKFNVNALGHIEEAFEVPATCVAAAKKDGIKCTREGCGEILKEATAYGNGLGHDYSVFVETVTEVTCTTDGEEIYKCSRCNATETRVVTKLGHDKSELMEVRVEPTCDVAGKGKFGCTRCNVWSLLPIEKLGHSMEEYRVKEATCTTVGHIFRVCSRCDMVATERVEALGHAAEKLEATEATCTAAGATEGEKCSRCDEILTAQEVIPMLPHTWKSYEAKEATCTEDGHSAYQECEVCGTTQNKEVYPAAHQFEDYKCTVCGARDSSCEHDNAVITVKKSTCTVAGSETFECPDCGYEFVETLALAEHQEVDQSVPATCTTKGLVHKVCAVCGKDLQKYEVDMNDHINVDGKCDACGTTLCTHANVTTETTASTCTQHGSKIETCTSCGKVTTKDLPLAAHNYVSGICSGCGRTDKNRVTYDFQDVFIVG